jgi:hypothetical protein
MKTPYLRLFYWLPRVLGLAFAGFISIFALDVFAEHHGFWPVLLALALHLIPTGLVLLLLALAWRWEWIGVLSFAGLALYYLVAFGGRFHWSAYVCIAGPLLLIAGLFLISWRLHTKAHLTAPVTSAP